MVNTLQQKANNIGIWHLFGKRHHMDVAFIAFPTAVFHPSNAAEVVSCLQALFAGPALSWSRSA
jgi:hypothetical protein